MRGEFLAREIVGVGHSQQLLPHRLKPTRQGEGGHISLLKHEITFLNSRATQELLQRKCRNARF